MKNLKQISLQGNPCTYKNPGIKHCILFKKINQIKIIDDEEVNDFDIDLARQYVKNNGLSVALLNKKSQPAVRIRQIVGKNIQHHENQTGSSLSTSIAQRETLKKNLKNKLYADEVYSADLVPIGKKFVRFEADQFSSSQLIEQLKEQINQLKSQNEKLNFKIFKWQNYDEIVKENQILKVEAQNVYILNDQNQNLRKQIKELKEQNLDTRTQKLNQQNEDLNLQCTKLRIKYQKLQTAYQKLDMVKWEEKLAAISKIRRKDREEQQAHLKHLKDMQLDIGARPQTSAGMAPPAPIAQSQYLQSQWIQRPNTAQLMQVEAIDPDQEMQLLDQEMRQLLKRNQNSLAELHDEFKSLSLITDEPTFRIRQTKVNEKKQKTNYEQLLPLRQQVNKN